jgi:hypothetical protein
VPSFAITARRPVDPRAPRVAAVLTSAVLAVALVTGSVWLLLGQAVVFALGAAHLSPYAVVFRRLVRPHLGPPADLEDPRPLRFAQVVGLLFTTAALLGALAGLPVLAVGATAAALAAAFLNAAFGICLGCEAYLLLQRVRVSRSAPDTRTLETTPTPFRSEVSA